MVGNVSALTQARTGTATASDAVNKVPEYTMYIPLQFWFCRNPGLALPLIALIARAEKCTSSCKRV